MRSFLLASVAVIALCCFFPAHAHAQQGGGGGIGTAPGAGSPGHSAVWVAPDILGDSGYGVVTVGRNRLINGDFRVSQYNGTNSVTPAASGYVIDRWSAAITTSGHLNFQQWAMAPPGPPYSTNAFVVTIVTPATVAATDTWNFQQPVEALNIGDSGFGAAGAQSLSLSFWAYSSVGGTYAGAITNYAFNRSYVFTFNLAVATWTRIVITIPGDTAGTWVNQGNAGAMRLFFDLGGGSSNATTPGVWTAGSFNTAPGVTQFVTQVANSKIYFTDIQLELAPPGATPAAPAATQYERRSFAHELLLCQRYFQTSYPIGTLPADGASGSTVGNAAAYTTAAARVLTQFSPPMRATPGMVAYRGTNAGTNGVWNFYYPSTTSWVAGTGMSLTANGAGGFTGQVNTNAGNFTLGLSYLIDGGWAASAEL